MLVRTKGLSPLDMRVIYSLCAHMYNCRIISQKDIFPFHFRQSLDNTSVDILFAMQLRIVANISRYFQSAHDLQRIKLHLSWCSRERKAKQKRAFGYKVKRFFLGFEERFYATERETVKCIDKGRQLHCGLARAHTYTHIHTHRHTFWLRMPKWRCRPGSNLPQCRTWIHEKKGHFGARLNFPLNLPLSLYSCHLDPILFHGSCFENKQYL